MREVGSYEAKTRLPELLKEVEKGETILITRRGHPVARLVPAQEVNQAQVRETIKRIREARKGRPKVSLDEILASIHEGHRY
jgi:prevent-host-death family protein